VQKDIRDFRGKGAYGLSFATKNIKEINKYELRKQERYMVIKSDEDCTVSLDIDDMHFNSTIQVCTYYTTDFGTQDVLSVRLIHIERLRRF
jgi:hypothetical protein